MIGIIGAMEQEVAALKAKMTDVSTTKIHATTFHTGLLEGKEVVLMQGGIGKVNAAYSTTLLLEHFNVTHLINIGSAGGLSLDEDVGDVVIADRCIHHDVDCLAFNYKMGQVPQMPEAYLSDGHLLEITKECLGELGINYHVGLIVSGDVFIARQDQVDTIKKNFPEAIAGEMEACTVSQVAYIYQKPFIILRSLSDVFGKGNSGMQFDTYLAKASENSALLCMKVVGRI